jgi:hypothetical protein
MMDPWGQELLLKLLIWLAVPLIALGIGAWLLLTRRKDSGRKIGIVLAAIGTIALALVAYGIWQLLANNFNR